MNNQLFAILMRFVSIDSSIILYHKVKAVAEICVNRYYCSEFVQGIIYTLVQFHNPDAPESERNDWCVVIALYKNLPPDFPIETEIDRIKIYTEVRPPEE